MREWMLINALLACSVVVVFGGVVSIFSAVVGIDGHGRFLTRPWRSTSKSDADSIPLWLRLNVFGNTLVGVTGMVLAIIACTLICYRRASFASSKDE